MPDDLLEPNCLQPQMKQIYGLISKCLNLYCHMFLNDSFINLYFNHLHENFKTQNDTNTLEKYLTLKFLIVNFFSIIVMKMLTSNSIHTPTKLSNS